MRIALAILALLPAISEVAAAPPHPGSPAGELRLVFLDGDDRAPVRLGASDGATIDVGIMVAGRCRSRGCMRMVVTRRFRMRVDSSSTTARFARIRAFVQASVPGQQVRLDGRLLTSAPQLVDPVLPLGITVAHTLELEVSTSAPAGALTQSIIWLVEST